MSLDLDKYIYPYCLIKLTAYKKGYEKIHLIRSVKKLIFGYQDLVKIYSVSTETIINDGFHF
jgi:hypothetical protein